MVRDADAVLGFFGRKPQGRIGGLEGDDSKASLTGREIETIAPNLADHMYLYRVTPGFADPPLCTIYELETVYTLDHLANFHEILDLRQAARAKAEREMKRQRETSNRRGRR